MNENGKKGESEKSEIKIAKKSSNELLQNANKGRCYIGVAVPGTKKSKPNRLCK